MNFQPLFSYYTKNLDEHMNIYLKVKTRNVKIYWLSYRLDLRMEISMDIWSFRKWGLKYPLISMLKKFGQKYP